MLVCLLISGVGYIRAGALRVGHLPIKSPFHSVMLYVYITFFMQAVVILKTCKHTLMCTKFKIRKKTKKQQQKTLHCPEQFAAFLTTCRSLHVDCAEFVNSFSLMPVFRKCSVSKQIPCGLNSFANI